MTHLMFIEQFMGIAREIGFKVEVNRKGQEQVDFGHKKLHAGHLAQMYPGILERDVNVAKIIDRVAPGRPCAHRPTKQIIARMNISSRGPVIRS